MCTVRSLIQRFIVLTLAAAAPAFAQDAAPVPFPFSADNWSVYGDARLAPYRGTEALLVRTGGALLNGAEFTDGVIEFDVFLEGPRAFPGISFRFLDEPRTAERFYVRPHNSGRFDAMQYTPTLNGQAAWQLYPEYNAARELPFGEWLHVRVEVEGSRMEITLNDDPEPVLVVEQLRTGNPSGAIVLESLFPAAARAPDVWPVAFANVSVEPRSATPLVARPGPAASSGLISEWRLSEPLRIAAADLTNLPKADTVDWMTVQTDSEGRLNIAEYRALPDGSGEWAVLARVQVCSPSDQSVRMGFGFSDRGTVFLNGDPLFAGDNTYLSRSGRYLGVMSVDNDALFVPLKAGENELTFVVSESFGGWGLTARLPVDRDLTVGPSACS